MNRWGLACQRIALLIIGGATWAAAALGLGHLGVQGRPQFALVMAIVIITLIPAARWANRRFPRDNDPRAV